MVSTSRDYKIKDMSLAEYGRKEIDIGIEGKTKGIQIMAGFCMPLGG